MNIHCLPQLVGSFHTLADSLAHTADLVRKFADLAGTANLSDVSRLVSTLEASINGTPLEFEDALTARKRKRKERRAAKDPLAPKRPASAYLMFQNEVRDRVKEDNKDKSYQEILKMISDEWKTMAEADKNVSGRVVLPRRDASRCF